jgi:hypothetical protein
MYEWEEIRPVLEAVYKALEDGGEDEIREGVSQGDISARLGREAQDPETGQQLEGLRTAGYITGTSYAVINGPLYCRLTEKGF